MTTLTAGSHDITAAYSGDANFGASAGATVQTVNAGNTLTQVSSAPDPSTVGQDVTIDATAAVSPASAR